MASTIYLTMNMISLLVATLFFSQSASAFQISGVGASATRISQVALSAAPKEALTDIVIPNVVDFSAYSQEINQEELEKEDPRVWVPQTDCLSFRPLCFCTSQGYYVNLLKFKGGGILGRHRHSSPVHALTLKGNWGYEEHDWNAGPGTYVFEPPGETHTLLVNEDCEEMVTMFHVTGSLLYTNDQNEVIGFDDVFSKLEKAKQWYAECGLGEDYVQQFVR
uniref:ChrR-like cupin domain-containing protein n=1 Tax=Chaetoceros debilis TaxID=122233 RepID=A0A7S3VGD4_9STRA|mmetsp:Transcript_21273/g.32304  ORF Transcript_21273/g.32304 Transcript_21273/m.32304 type:complete len:221 (+) Transcript_21273:31-693(+)